MHRIAPLELPSAPGLSLSLPLPPPLSLSLSLSLALALALARSLRLSSRPPSVQGRASLADRSSLAFRALSQLSRSSRRRSARPASPPFSPLPLTLARLPPPSPLPLPLPHCRFVAINIRRGVIFNRARSARAHRELAAGGRGEAHRISANARRTSNRDLSIIRSLSI